MSFKLSRILSIAALAVVFATASAAQAGIVTLNYSGGGQTATAVLDFQSGFVDVTLTNTTSGITDAGGLFTRFDFTLSSGTGSAGMTGVADRMVDFTSNSSGDITGTTGFGTGDIDITDEWVIIDGGSTLRLDWNSGTGPDTGIIASGWGSLSNSLAPGATHNPLVLDSAKFRVTRSGITADTTVNSSAFWFGTTPNLGDGTITTGSVTQFSVTAVPLPPAAAMGLAFLCALGAFSWARRRKAATFTA